MRSAAVTDIVASHRIYHMCCYIFLSLPGKGFRAKFGPGFVGTLMIKSVHVANRQVGNKPKYHIAHRV